MVEKEKNIGNRLSLFWRFQVQENHRYTPLVQYLNDSNKDLPYTKTEMFLQAMSAFWYPFALKWIGRPKEEIKSAGAFAIKALELHIALIKDELGLENQGQVSTKEDTNPPLYNNTKLAKEDTNESKSSSELEKEAKIVHKDLSFHDQPDIIKTWMS